MKALLLSAGLGTRLRPVTNFLPKCMVPINGKPLLEYWLDNLSNAGIDEFIVNTHYFKDVVEEYIKNCKYKDKITVVYEKELLLTAGTILNCKEYLKDDDFMVIHADNFSFCDFEEFIQVHKSRPKYCKITMMTFTSENPSQCGVVELDDNNVVNGFFEKLENPPTNLANGAVYILDKEIFTFLDSFKKIKIDFSTEVLPEYINKIYTYHNNIYHRDIGTLESYALSQIEGLKFV